MHAHGVEDISNCSCVFYYVFMQYKSKMIVPRVTKFGIHDDLEDLASIGAKRLNIKLRSQCHYTLSTFARLTRPCAANHVP